jgi:hypothetical protein
LYGSLVSLFTFGINLPLTNIFSGIIVFSGLIIVFVGKLPKLIILPLPLPIEILPLPLPIEIEAEVFLAE